MKTVENPDRKLVSQDHARMRISACNSDHCKLYPIIGSIWGKPNRSFYRFLAMIETVGLPKTLCVLGCSDGKFVIPAARKGFSVLALDIDTIALYGGEIDLLGEKVVNVGM